MTRRVPKVSTIDAKKENNARVDKRILHSWKQILLRLHECLIITLLILKQSNMTASLKNLLFLKLKIQFHKKFNYKKICIYIDIRTSCKYQFCNPVPWFKVVMVLNQFSFLINMKLDPQEKS